MSHLAHIVKLKQDLIANKVVAPADQIAVVRTAYVKALINVNAVNKLDEDQCINFNRFVLGYWNEVTPVNGPLVMAMIGKFFRSFEAFVASTITANTLEIQVVDKVEGVDFKWEELDSYRELVQTLIAEGKHKLEQFLPTDNIV